jgi:hypothetical protein
MRNDWILLVGQRLSELGAHGHPVQLGCAMLALWAKGVPGAPPESGWAGVEPGLPVRRWAEAFSGAKCYPTDTLHQALAREIAAGEVRSESIPLLGHDRRRDGQPFLDPDVRVTVEPRPRRAKAGRPLAGPDPLVAIHGLFERGFEFPPGLLHEDDLEAVHAFLTRSDTELANEWGVTLVVVRKRRERLRKRMSQIISSTEGGFMDTPTLVEHVQDIDIRLREVERQVGLPEGGTRAATLVVEAFLEDVQAETESEE